MKQSEARRAERDAKRDSGSRGTRPMPHEGMLARYLSAFSYDEKASSGTDTAAEPSSDATTQR